MVLSHEKCITQNMLTLPYSASYVFLDPKVYYFFKN